MTLKDPAVVAFLRGIFIAFITAGAVFFEADDDPWRAAGVTFFTAMLIRFGVEGAWDTVHNRKPPAVVFEPWAPPIPPVDFDSPYHRSPRGVPHPGNDDAKCRWCLQEAAGET